MREIAILGIGDRQSRMEAACAIARGAGFTLIVDEAHDAEYTPQLKYKDVLPMLSAFSLPAATSNVKRAYISPMRAALRGIYDPHGVLRQRLRENLRRAESRWDGCSDPARKRAAQYASSLAMHAAMRIQIAPGVTAGKIETIGGRDFYSNLEITNAPVGGGVVVDEGAFSPGHGIAVDASDDEDPYSANIEIERKARRNAAARARRAAKKAEAA